MGRIIRIKDASNHTGETVTIRGWLHSLRKTSNTLFPVIRDGSTGLMHGIVAKSRVSAEVYQQIANLTHESSIIVTGKISTGTMTPSPFQLDVEEIAVIQRIPESDPYPLRAHIQGAEYLVRSAHLRVRVPRQQAILKARHEVIRAVREYLDQRGFTSVDTPILIPPQKGGTPSAFELPYFRDMAGLSRSGYLYASAAAMALGDVYTLGPRFSAVPSKSSGVLTEYWMVELEMAFANLDDLMNLAEKLVYHVVQSVLRNRQEELSVLQREVSALGSARFPHISYSEALDLLRGHGKDLAWGNDLAAIDEALLGSKFELPVLVSQHPVGTRSFSIASDSNASVALSVDLLVPGGYGKILCGGQRIHDVTTLYERMRERNLPIEDLEWYVDLHKYGGVPHAGLAMSIERVVAWICGINHLWEVAAFPRMADRIRP